MQTCYERKTVSQVQFSKIDLLHACVRVCVYSATLNSSGGSPYVRGYPCVRGCGALGTHKTGPVLGVYFWPVLNRSFRARPTRPTSPCPSTWLGRAHKCLVHLSILERSNSLMKQDDQIEFNGNNRHSRASLALLKLPSDTYVASIPKMLGFLNKNLPRRRRLQRNLKNQNSFCLASNR